MKRQSTCRSIQKNKFNGQVLLGYSEHVYLASCKHQINRVGNANFAPLRHMKFIGSFSTICSSSFLGHHQRKQCPVLYCVVRGRGFHIYMRFFYNPTTLAMLVSSLCEKGRGGCYLWGIATPLALTRRG